jgi:hypothetical protein
MTAFIIAGLPLPSIKRAAFNTTTPLPIAGCGLTVGVWPKNMLGPPTIDKRKMKQAAAIAVLRRHMAWMFFIVWYWTSVVVSNSRTGF